MILRTKYEKSSACTCNYLCVVQIKWFHNVECHEALIIIQFYKHYKGITLQVCNHTKCLDIIIITSILTAISLSPLYTRDKTRDKMIVTRSQWWKVLWFIRSLPPPHIY